MKEKPIDTQELQDATGMSGGDLERWIETAKERFEQKAIEADEVLPLLILQAKGETRALLSSSNPRGLVSLARMAWAGFEADEVLLLVDTNVATSATNPEGEPWEVGEMQRRKREPAVAAMLQEALVVFRGADRQLVTACIPYKRKRGRLVWDDPMPTTGDGSEMVGFMPDTLREVINTPPLSATAAPFYEQLNELYGEMPADYKLLHQALGTVKALKQVAHEHHIPLAVAVPFPDDEYTREAIRESGIPGGEIMTLEEGSQ